MHVASVVVLLSEVVVGLRRLLRELIFVSWRHILCQESDMGIAIVAALLMVEAQCVCDFMCRNTELKLVPSMIKADVYPEHTCSHPSPSDIPCSCH